MAEIFCMFIPSLVLRPHLGTRLVYPRVTLSLNPYREQNLETMLSAVEKHTCSYSLMQGLYLMF